MERVKFSALVAGEKFILDGNIWHKKAEGYAMFRHGDFIPVAFFDGKIFVLEEPFSGKVSVKEFRSVEEAFIAKAKKELSPYDRGLI